VSSSANKPQLLVLLSRFPYPLEKGDKLRAYYQLEELSKNYRITLFATSDKPITNNDFEKVESLCEHVEVQYLSRGKRFFSLLLGLFSDLPFQVHYFRSLTGMNKVKTLILDNEFEHIYCQLIRSAEYVKNIHHIPKTIDYMDAFSAGVERRIAKRKWYDKWLFRLESKRLRKYERKIFDFFEHHTIISEQDRSLIAHPDKHKIVAIPNGIAPHFFEDLKRTETHDFVFVGNMSYPPNIDAVHYIAEHILPSFPTSTLLISGATPHASLKKLASSHKQIEMTGWVDDIRDSYLDGKIFLAPMTIGTGMQNKLMEAMALQTPCITTDLANNAIGAINNKHILVGNTPEEIISKIHELLESDEKRQVIASAAQHFVQERYSWERTTNDLVSLMRQKGTKSNGN
jgi:sugar transferase (PEP-CTERM/EpsH1 system associated)